jgi:hypothetical protein
VKSLVFTAPLMWFLVSGLVAADGAMKPVCAQSTSLLSAPARPGVEISAGYMFYSPTERNPVQGLVSLEPGFGGGLVSVAVNIKSHFALVGEATYLVGIGAAGFTDEGVHSFMGGPRFVARRASRLPGWLGGNTATLGLFTQVLVGGNSGGDRTGGFAFQPGAGLVWERSTGPSLFVEIDGVFIQGNEAYGPGPRIGVGATFGF